MLFCFLNFFLCRVIHICSQLCVSTLRSPTGTVQTASQLSGHHLHDEAYPESEHVPEQSRLGAHVHGEIDHDFLYDKHAQFTGVGAASDKSPAAVQKAEDSPE